MDQVLIAIEDRIAILQMNRPKALNAINPEVMGLLYDAVQKCIADESVLGIIITGVGEKAFVAGADISAFVGKNATEATALSQQGHHTFDLIESSPKPVIAAINGYALGGGLELALACHLRIAGKKAKMGLPEAHLGLVPGFGGTARLFEVVGPTRAAEMILTTQMIDAEKALDWGLINKVCHAGQELQTAKDLLDKVLGNGPLALGHALRLLQIAKESRKASFLAEIQTFGQLFASADAQEGISAFLEKRPANFIGK